ncbi:MAG: AAA family ATPase [Promethearchaeota archaeon]
MNSFNHGCIILCGLPASGKSYFASSLKKAIEEQASGTKVDVIDIDDIRDIEYKSCKINDDFIPELEKEVRSAKYETISESLRKGHFVIDDDLNYFRSMRKKVIEICASLNIFYAIIHIATPISYCIEWNVGRECEVPDDVLIRVNEQFDMPGDRNYKWDVPFSIIAPNEKNFDMMTAAKQTASRFLSALSSLKTEFNGYFKIIPDDSKEHLFYLNLAMIDDNKTYFKGLKNKNHEVNKQSKVKKDKSELEHLDIEFRRMIHDHVLKEGQLKSKHLKKLHSFKKEAVTSLKKGMKTREQLIKEFKNTLLSLKGND